MSSITEKLLERKLNKKPTDWSFYRYNRNVLLGFIAAGGIISLILRFVLLALMR